jgi:hypothetical protein
MSPLNELAEIRARLEERAKQRASYQGTASAIDIKHPTISPKEAKSRFPQLRSKSADPEPVTSEVRVAPVFACGFYLLYSVRPSCHLLSNPPILPVPQFTFQSSLNYGGAN